MFGYVKVNSAELKVKEHEFYRGAYCGLCRAMGKCTGCCSRMTLNYDFVFLALVRLSLEPESISFEQKRCLAHPLKKRNSMVRNRVLDYCAYASAILNYQKVRDDLSDEKGFRKLRARIAYPFVAHARKRALKKDPSLTELDTLVSKRLDELSAIEDERQKSVDIPAQCFGLILGDIMSFGLEGKSKRIISELGRSIGAWIYIADAIDDMPDDLAKQRYNPFIELYDGRLPCGEEFRSISDAIKNLLLGAESAFDLLDECNETIDSIIRNILYIGIPDRTEEIIKENENRQTKEKIRKEISDD